MVKTFRLLALDIDGVLTDGTTLVGENVSEAKRVNFQDLDAVTEAKKAGLEVAFVTGETSSSVDLIAQRFDVQNVIKGAKDKVAALTELASRFAISMSEICYVGDSNRDASALACVGLGVAPANATPAAKHAAHRILQKAGGTGAVAETVALLLQIQDDEKNTPTQSGDGAMKCYLCNRQDLTQLTTQLREGDGVVWYCDHCKLGILQNQVSADLNTFYRDDYRKHYGPDLHKVSKYSEIFESYVNYQDQRVELLKPYLHPEKKLLEVGCSTGHFLYNIKEFVGEAVGVDYDAGAAEFAHNICQCETFGCDMNEAGLLPASFDIACAIQTMEHVEDPVHFAKSLGNYLKLDGVIYIEVPNLYDPLLSVYENSAYRTFWFRAVHLFYFTPQSLKILMKKAGFEGEVHFTQDYNFLNHLSWIMRGIPQPTCHEGLSSPKLPVSKQVKPELRQDLNNWLASLDKEYKVLLAKHGVTSNITYIGRRV